MKKRFLSVLLALLMMLPVLVLTVSADCGPKPSTVITVHTGGGERAIVTLLAESEGWGPNHTIGPEEGPADWMVKNKLNLLQTWLKYYVNIPEDMLVNHFYRICEAN